MSPGIANLFEHQEKSSFHIPLHHLFILTLIEGYPLLSQKLCIPHVDRDFMKSVIIAPLHVCPAPNRFFRRLIQLDIDVPLITSCVAGIPISQSCGSGQMAPQWLLSNSTGA
tara:strand:- start:1253 stop:1588 length:336 start_codon:yes stop_codon:yes gene_type:complete